MDMLDIAYDNIGHGLGYFSLLFRLLYSLPFSYLSNSLQSLWTTICVLGIEMGISEYTSWARGKASVGSRNLPRGVSLRLSTNFLATLPISASSSSLASVWYFSSLKIAVWWTLTWSILTTYSWVSFNASDPLTIACNIDDWCVDVPEYPNCAAWPKSMEDAAVKRIVPEGSSQIASLCYRSFSFSL